MTDKAWKRTERDICRLFGGERRGADYADQDGGKNDCINEFWSIEVKRWKRPIYSAMYQDVLNAEARASAGQIPIGVFLKKGQNTKDGLVSMRLETFLEWFVS